MSEKSDGLPEFLEKDWQAQFNDLIGGWCITLAEDDRTPAEGAKMFGDFMTRDLAVHVVELHNRDRGANSSELGRRITQQRGGRDG